MAVGTVYLIGAGPGDPGLITVRGLELLRRADVVVYDRLAHPSHLNHVRADAERVYVGKASAHHAMRQDEINALLVERARQGKSVARLKGGDPVVFGRGGEEAEFCRAAGVPFEFVPGVTSAIAAPTYAGIPVTHRDLASSFAIVTGHERDDRGEAGTRAPGTAEGRRNWATLAHAADTLVFLMGVEALPEIAARLQEHGRASETPVALVQWGTWPSQRVVTGTLATIVDNVKAAGITPPAVCVVGDVVKLRPALQWFDDLNTRPLFGKRIVVTRAREQASALSDLLRSRGAEPVEFPVISIAAIEDTTRLDAALRTLERYAWMAVTSVNAVPILAARLDALQLDARAFHATRIAAIGPATAQAIRQQLGLRADFVPTEAVAEAVLSQWPDAGLSGQRILLPRAREARELLPEQLAERGAEVDVIPVYETLTDAGATDELRSQLAGRELDMLTFTASSTVHNFARALVTAEADLKSLIGATPVAAIGPITADTLRSYGIEPQIVAVEHTIPGLVNAIEANL
jgi:uroporphyrinogen III methyltransferase/synthase